MQITVRGKNLDVTPALRDYAEKKIGKIEKYFDMPLAAQVTLGVENDRYIVEVTVPLNGMLLRGEKASGDIYSSIDLVMETLEKQIEKYKTKIARRLRDRPLLNNEKDLPLDDDEIRIVRVKKFDMKPMNPEEAILQMNLVGHSFFVFANAENGKVSVVYRRHDGNYGLIEPGF
ncbi:MAG: ribosome-associated translation inhibitor RaiA [Bacillota bacterium]